MSKKYARPCSARPLHTCNLASPAASPHGSHRATFRASTPRSLLTPYLLLAGLTSWRPLRSPWAARDRI
ncbi:MAG: hypothetical protein JSS93_01030 [Bacteroidetes bacterium]|nr:hypothetical protein [Bacteroidota bacterium]MBS1558340.1 hypothetical protein [Bacteroidota bacterium]